MGIAMVMQKSTFVANCNLRTSSSTLHFLPMAPEPNNDKQFQNEHPALPVALSTVRAATMLRLPPVLPAHRDEKQKTAETIGRHSPWYMHCACGS